MSAISPLSDFRSAPVRRFATTWALLVAAIFFALGCRSTDAMRQRCIAGELSDCESTCKKGIAGEGGCFHAAELYRTSAALDFKSREFGKASGYFAQACDGKYADGCLFAAQMIEAPFASLDAPPSKRGAGERSELDANPDSMPNLIADDDVALREKRLVAACDLGSAAGCKRLGDVLVGKNAARATEAYEKACKMGRDGEPCIVARTKDVEVFERFATSCKKSVADACTRLGALLFAVDPPRALRLFASECELRGVAKVEGSAGRFVRMRLKQARQGTLLFEDPVPSREALAAFDVRAEDVQGRLAFVEADRALHMYAASLGACAAELPPGTTGDAKLRLTVDRTGDVYRAEVVSGSMPASVSACIASGLEGVSFGATGEIVTLNALATTPAARN